MKPLLDSLPPDKIETLLEWCETQSYIEVSNRAQTELAMKISPASLCRLNTRHRIEQDREARAELLGDNTSNPQTALLNLASDQLHLRLVELASRPNPSAAELRALFQIINRLEALKLSERRVAVSEKRESRMQARMDDDKAQRERKNAPRRSLPVEEVRHRVRVVLGKEAPRPGDNFRFGKFEDSDADFAPPLTANSDPQKPDAPCGPDSSP